jgi:hypothetical protein
MSAQNEELVTTENPYSKEEEDASTEEGTHFKGM